MTRYPSLQGNSHEGLGAENLEDSVCGPREVSLEWRETVGEFGLLTGDVRYGSEEARRAWPRVVNASKA